MRRPVRSRRWLMGVAAVLVLGLFPQGSFAAVGGGTVQQTDNGFSPASPFNTPLPADVPLAANSQAIVNNIVQDSEQSLGLWAINTESYSAPIYYADENTPLE